MNDFALGQSFVFVPLYLCHMCATHTPSRSIDLDFIQSSDNYATKFEKYFIKFCKGLWQNDFIWRLFFIPKGLFTQIYAQFCMHTKKIQINTRTISDMYMLLVLTSFTY